MKIFRTLAENGQQSCGSILPAVPKSTLTRHWQVLRDSGVIWQHPHGRETCSPSAVKTLTPGSPGCSTRLSPRHAPAISKPARSAAAHSF